MIELSSTNKDESYIHYSYIKFIVLTYTYIHALYTQLYIYYFSQGVHLKGFTKEMLVHKKTSSRGQSRTAIFSSFEYMQQLNINLKLALTSEPKLLPTCFA